MELFSLISIGSLVVALSPLLPIIEKALTSWVRSVRPRKVIVKVGDRLLITTIEGGRILDEDTAARIVSLVGEGANATSGEHAPTPGPRLKE
jgi:hypothetical protein